MANHSTKRDAESMPANTVERTTSTSVSTHVGRNTVQIDARALRCLIDTLRARLHSEAKARN